MTILSKSASAKLNLSLKVLGKRDDGFHEIETLMVKLPGLVDTLVFQEASAFSLSCDDPTLTCDESNLVTKAVRAYETASGNPCRFSITLKKSIPHGAGLGGGSSDAAATLLGLDELNNGKLGAKTLHALAAEIGSDVAFFLKPGAARCTGRGEIIEPIQAPPSFPVLLLKPSFGVSTPDAYRRWSGSAELAGISYGPQEVSGVTFTNDLERPVFEKNRFLAELKQWLLPRNECAAALMAGSGSTVFAVLHADADARNLARAAHHELDPGLWQWCGSTEG